MTPLNSIIKKLIVFFIIVLSIIFIWNFFVKSDNYDKKEQLSVTESYKSLNEDSSSNYIPLKDNTTFKQLNTSPSSVLLTGIDNIRILPIYKLRSESDKNILFTENSSYYSDPENRNGEDKYNYFMPGIDIINGYNLINLGYYDINTQKLSYLFQKPVLIKTFYFPSLERDSIDKKPITRNYFMVSVYDEDTNKDSLINNKDLRKFYHIDQFNTKHIQILPKGYSSVRSTYDYKNDIMYIYARKDINKNGTPDKEEPLNIFWIRLSEPTILQKFY
jgi:hypothetical protein